MLAVAVVAPVHGVVIAVSAVAVIAAGPYGKNLFRDVEDSGLLIEVVRGPHRGVVRLPLTCPGKADYAEHRQDHTPEHPAHSDCIFSLVHCGFSSPRLNA